MHIYVHLRWIELDEKKRDWELPFHQRGVIALLQRRPDDRTLDRASIHKNKLLRATRPAHSGLPD